MNNYFIAGLFVLVGLIITGVFALSLPLARQLARYLDHRMRSNGGDALGADEIRKLQATVEALRSDVQSIADRQAFVENLLESRSSVPPALPVSNEKS